MSFGRPRFRRAPIALVLLLALVASRPLGATMVQCPDGTPPPCGAPRPAPREPSRAPDPNRIAVLPFRVTTADTLLGEGFAELLATEFTGEGSPRAVDMATVLSAWRRAGGGLRTPLARAEAVRMARVLGAGLVSDGSIIGLGGRVTVTASLIGVADGRARGAPTRVTGTADSLDALLRQAATGLLAAVGGQQRSVAGARYSDSPGAMRHYIEGLSAWRRGQLEAAARAFDRAIAEDSGFAQALYRRYLATGWGFPGIGPYARLTWERRDRLAPSERTVLEGFLGPEYPRARPIEERFAGRQRAADLLPDSPDALYAIGDYHYHWGSAFEPFETQMRLAREYLERAAAIDSQATVLRHLVEIGVQLRDTALLRRVWPAYDRTDDQGKWAGLWLAAAAMGDQALLAALRRRPVPPDNTFGGTWPLGTEVGSRVPARLLDEMADRILAAIPGADIRAIAQTQRGFGMAVRGRPAAAERAWSGVPPEFALWADVLRMHLAVTGTTVGLDVARIVERIEAVRTGDSATVAQARCLAVLWRLDRGERVEADTTGFRRHARRCARALEVRGLRPDAAEDGLRLAAADSAVRGSIAFGNPLFAGSADYEALILARAWEARGERGRALAAIRYRLFGAGFGDGLTTLREEARLAEAVGDTVGAVRALRVLVEITADAEPVVLPVRDSARAELARLERR